MLVRNVKDFPLLENFGTNLQLYLCLLQSTGTGQSFQKY